MEPCRGGALASLDEQAEALLRAARPKDSIASWAFRFLQSLPNVMVVLSGMNTMEQLMENIEIFSKDEPTTEEEKGLLQKAVSTMVDSLPCTGCRYCCDACPQGLDIPKLISIYNELSFDRPNTLQYTLGAMTEDELPGACIQCGSCKELCPQGINVPYIMKQAAEAIAEYLG